MWCLDWPIYGGEKLQWLDILGLFIVLIGERLHSLHALAVSVSISCSSVLLLQVLSPIGTLPFCKRKKWRARPILLLLCVKKKNRRYLTTPTCSEKSSERSATINPKDHQHDGLGHHHHPSHESMLQTNLIPNIYLFCIRLFSFAHACSCLDL